MENVIALLSQRINKPDIRYIVLWCLENDDNIKSLYELSKSDDERISVNSLWCLTHLPKEKSAWLQSKQDEIIDRLLQESHTAKKRIMLQILREQEFSKDSIRTDFIDFCFSKINSECEPYAVRCFSIYCAFKVCRFFPELIEELKGYLDMLSLQNLSPGLKCALRTTRQNI